MLALCHKILRYIFFYPIQVTIEDGNPVALFRNIQCQSLTHGT